MLSPLAFLAPVKRCVVIRIGREAPLGSYRVELYFVEVHVVIALDAENL